MESRRLTVDGHEVAVLAANESATGTPAIFLHGILTLATNTFAYWLMTFRLPSASLQHEVLKPVDPLSRGWITTCNIGLTILTGTLSN